MSCMREARIRRIVGLIYLIAVTSPVQLLSSEFISSLERVRPARIRTAAEDGRAALRSWIDLAHSSRAVCSEFVYSRARGTGRCKNDSTHMVFAPTNAMRTRSH